MFNIGLLGAKKDFKQNFRPEVLVKRKSLNTQGQQMDTQVKKVLGQKGQGLILMVR